MESAELKNQRLKEVFQKKIQEFRTACYVLTGYQIDITVENQYRLTSVYAEHMEDSLLFKVNSYANVFVTTWPMQFTEMCLHLDTLSWSAWDMYLQTRRKVESTEGN